MGTGPLLMLSKAYESLLSRRCFRFLLQVLFVYAEDEMASTVSESAPSYEMLLLADVSFVLILLKIWLMLWPIVVKTKTAAAPIKTNNNEYSTMSCPCSSLINSLIIGFSPVLPGYGLKRLSCVEINGRRSDKLKLAFQQP